MALAVLNDMNFSRAKLIEKCHNCFERYEKRLNQTQHHPSMGRIHSLRVSIRRLEALLLMLKNLALRDFEIQKMLSKLRKISRQIGELRDLQVASIFYKNYAILGICPLKIDLVEKKVSQFLKRVPIKKQKVGMNSIVLELREVRDLRLQLKENYSDLNHEIEKINDEIKVVTFHPFFLLHHLRQNTKSLGYQREIFEASQIPDLTTFAKIVGDLQNLRVLKKLVQKNKRDLKKKVKIEWLKQKRKKLFVQLSQLQRRMK
jgi:CHAD domain-containing protein